MTASTHNMECVELWTAAEMAMGSLFLLFLLLLLLLLLPPLEVMASPRPMDLPFPPDILLSSFLLSRSWHRRDQWRFAFPIVA